MDIPYEYMHHSLLSNEEEVKYLKSWKQFHDEAAKDALIQSNIRLVLSICKKHPYFRDFGDLVHEGIIGLIEAIDNFDEKRIGIIKFSTYATYRINKKVYEALQNPNKIVAMGKNTSANLIKLRKLMSEPSNRTISEIQSYLNWSDTQIDRLLLAKQIEDASSFSQEITVETFKTVKDSVETEAERSVTQEEVLQSLNNLSDMERTVIEMYYGINKETPTPSYSKIAELLKTSTDRIKSLERTARSKLKEKLHYLVEEC